MALKIYYCREQVPFVCDDGEVVIAPPGAYVASSKVTNSLNRHLKKGRVLLRNPRKGTEVITGKLTSFIK